jgi:DNA processing protein
VTEREAAVAIVLADGAGPATAARLVDEFGSYAAALEAVAGGARADGIKPGVLTALRDGAAGRSWEAELALAHRAGARFAVPGDGDYPEVLSEIAGAPVGLFVSGGPLGMLTPMVGVVGSRTPTPRGSSVATRLAADLARAGVTVVSGLARGVDTRAHEGALAAGGPTVAVLGCGLACIYPPENAGLARDIAANGALVSEFPMRSEPLPGCFPRRNRIISGLSAGVVVVEAAARSGALITAARALEQGREVFAVPGPVDEPLSAGPNRLIKAGAKLTEDAADVLDELERAWGPFPVEGAGLGGPESEGRGTEPSQDAGRGLEPPRDAPCETLEDHLLEAVSRGAASVDELVESSGAPVERVLSTLLVLELADRVARSPGGRFVPGERERARAARRREDD